MNVKTLSIPLFLILFCCMLGCRNKHHNKMDETAPVSYTHLTLPTT